MKFLCVFNLIDEDFRLAELDSCAKIFNVPIQYDASQFKATDIYLYVDFPSEEDARKVVGRSVLLK
jgi:tRNA (guanine10-N2)-methyltransferase